MKKHRGKRRKKTKTLHAKETSTNEAYEINSLREKVKEMKPGELKFNLVCEEHYSLYERTSVREETRKEDASSEPALENELKDETKRVLKGQRKSALPPLREKAQRRKRLTFEGTRRACKHSTLDTKPEEDKNDMTENIAPTSSEGQKLKKVASLSFVGIYDLDDMDKTETKKSNKLDSILKSSKQGAEDEISCEKNDEERVEEPDDLRTNRYVIQTLTLEGQSPLSNRTLFQDKFILPGINKSSLSTRSNKIVDDAHRTSQRRERQYRESKKLPNIVQSENRTPRNSHRGKLRVHDNSFEQVYLDRNIPRLPLIVNGRMTQS